MVPGHHLDGGGDGAEFHFVGGIGISEKKKKKKTMSEISCVLFPFAALLASLITLSFFSPACGCMAHWPLQSAVWWSGLVPVFAFLQLLSLIGAGKGNKFSFFFAACHGR